MTGLIVACVVVIGVLSIASGIGFILLERRQREFEAQVSDDILTLARAGMELAEAFELEQEQITLLAEVYRRHERSLDAVSRIFGELVSEGFPQVSPHQGRKSKDKQHKSS